jgi:hypothetical protein
MYSSVSTQEKIVRGRALMPSIYILALVCLFLPFFNFQCSRTAVAQMNGMDMAVGNKVEVLRSMIPFLRQIEAENRRDNPKAKRTDFRKEMKLQLPVNYWALATVGVLVTGLFISLVPFSRRYLVLIFTSGATLGLLFAILLTRNGYLLRAIKLKDKIPGMDGMMDNFEAIFNLKPLYGFWVAIGLMAIASYVAVKQHQYSQREYDEHLADELLAGDEMESPPPDYSGQI